MADRNAPDHIMCGLQRHDPPDSVIAALADAQHGVVSRDQLIAAGLTPRQIEWRVKRQRLRVVHRRVYAVGHAVLSQHAVWMAAVLSAGEGAVLSHWSAASLLRLRSGRGPRSHVTSPRNRRNADAISFHHAALPADEVTVENGIPVTTPARTALDLARSLPSHVLLRMVAATRPHPGLSLTDLLDRYPRKPGVAKLRTILAKPLPMTRSNLEAAWLERIELAGLPRPAANANVEGYEVDLVWEEHGVIAELDSYVTHGSAIAFESDRRRDRKLAAAGWRVVRLTQADPDDALEDLNRLLLAASEAHARGRSARAA